MRMAGFALGCSAVVALASCAEGNDDAFDLPLNAYVPEGTVMSEHQQATIARYQETGDVSYEDYAQARWDFLECMDEAGFSYEAAESRFMGYPIIIYGINAPPEYLPNEEAGEFIHPVMDQIWLHCANTYETVVDELYTTVRQREAVPLLQNAYAPLIEQCLVAYGIDVSGAEEFNDLTALAYELVDTEPDWGVPNCLDESGYSGEFSAGWP